MRNSQPLKGDLLLLSLILALASLPYGQVFHLRLPIITLNAFELLSLATAFLLAKKIITNGKIYHMLPFYLFLFVIATWSSAAWAQNDVSIREVFWHVRKFLPYMIATMVLVVGTSVEPEIYLRLLSISAAISAMSALMIQYYAPDFLYQAFSSSKEVVDISIMYGRLYWTNASLSMFVLLTFFLQSSRLRTDAFFKFGVLPLVSLALFNTFNRTFIIGVALFMVGVLFLSQRKKAGTIFKILLVVLVLATAVFFLSSLDDRVIKLIELRYFGSGHGLEGVYEKAVVSGRYGIYDSYLSIIDAHLFLGQGLGRPLYSTNGLGIYTSDISVMSFMIPFGLMGLVTFSVFVFRLFRIVHDDGWRIGSYNKKILILFLAVSLFMSLNIDLFSRRNFVIYLAYFIMTLKNSNYKVPGSYAH